MDFKYPAYFFTRKPYRLPARLLQIIAVCGCVFFLNSCTGTSKLPAGKQLYTGATVKLKSDERIPRRAEKRLLPQLEAVITPKPNLSFLGVRPKLAFHNLVGEPKREKGFKNFLAHSIGEHPIYYDSVNNRKVTDLMVNRLNNNGFFNSRIEVKETKRKKSVSVVYTAVLAKPYRISEVIFPTGDSSQTQIHKDIAATAPGTRLKPGQIYNLNRLIEERQRIDSILKNNGYYYFGPDFLLFKADSSYKDHTIKLYVQLKPGTPEKARRPYTVKSVIIYSDYTIGYDTIPMKPPVVIRGYRYYPDENSLRARHLLSSVFLEPGKLYARQDHALTLSRIMGLGLFKFVDVNFTEGDSTKGELNAALRLVPMMNQSFRVELETTAKTNGFAGPGINFSYRHRNFMRGAESFVLTLRAGQESQVSKRNSSDSGLNQALNSVELGLTADLYVPRFITPFKIRNLRSEFVPKTRFRLGYDYQNRTNYYMLNGYLASYSYIWKPRKTVTHEVTPINVQLTKLMNQTPAFEELLAQNRYLAQSFQEQFIIGSLYSYTYNTQLIPGRNDNYYFNGIIEGSGNLVGLLTGGFGKSTGEPIEIMGQPYSQYTKLDLDFRYYHTFASKSTLATRIITGLGLPYGNSSTLPYIKQYFIGGSNSIRAFRARSVGPGVFRDTTNSGFFDQSGDIKFEANIEYRFKLIAPYLEGALFVDAGNIWLSSPTPDKPGAEFHLNKFFNQLAIGTGFGFRINAQVVVFRFDFGIPVRAPYEALGEQTVLKIPPPTKDMVINIAIGYPF
ncbi:BamA/TamA family outer membrane protein [Adhaeribacter sp. BT258]|uniref:BamA/TamA family outer membrane protein n=1 Tax=Adhaeribacter terrigena TaxID=2793070 RepID=A0ABS1C3K1_9BACT|nr:BamA/TamA family outer membrane protein [Adhaeribacter terrigena]MBK0403731.1 BamA/TamA family outer membrane protein [Adhaeribacter terrigena]